MTTKQIARNGRVSQADIKARLHYDSATGIFTRIQCAIKKHRLGVEAGRKHPNGYRIIKVGHQDFLAHRLAWLYMTGDWPDACIDHINGIRDDNRWSNLRSATDNENRRNRKTSANNTSGCSGVFWEQNKRLWRARISVNGKIVSLGRHKSLSHAIAVRKRAEQEYWGDFAPSQAA